MCIAEQRGVATTEVPGTISFGKNYKIKICMHCVSHCCRISCNKGSNQSGMGLECPKQDWKNLAGPGCNCDLHLPEPLFTVSVEYLVAGNLQSLFMQSVEQNQIYNLSSISSRTTPDNGVDNDDDGANPFSP
jgi:hypothetical protein